MPCQKVYGGLHKIRYISHGFDHIPLHQWCQIAIDLIAKSHGVVVSVRNCPSKVTCPGWHHEGEKRRNPGDYPNYNYTEEPCPQLSSH